MRAWVMPAWRAQSGRAVPERDQALEPAPRAAGVPPARDRGKGDTQQPASLRGVHPACELATVAGGTVEEVMHGRVADPGRAGDGLVAGTVPP